MNIVPLDEDPHVVWPPAEHPDFKNVKSKSSNLDSSVERFENADETLMDQADLQTPCTLPPPRLNVL